MHKEGASVTAIPKPLPPNEVMFFQEFVEQHRIHCVVAHGVDLAVGRASHQIRIHLFHFLGHEA